MQTPGSTWAPVAVFLSAFAVVVTVAFADGGYFRETWGWTAVALSLLAGIALLLHERIALGRLELGTMGAMAGLVAWIALSALWSASPGDSLRESQRGLIYAAALLAFPLVVRPERIRELLGGLTAGVSVVATYSLAARLFPSEPVATDPVEGTLLIEPLGYANALGILAALGALLSLGFAVHAHARLTRALGAAGPIVLLPTLTLTGSRAAGLALAAGFCVWALLESQRRKLVASILLVALPALVGVWVTARSSALTDSGATLDETASAGHRVALVIGLFALAAGLASMRSAWIEAQVAQVRISLAIPVATALVLLSTAVVAALATQRSLGPRADYWRVAWNEFQENAWLGSGAGTFAEYWQRSGVPTGVSDAHSLYLETLAELGPFGFALLLVVLGLPLVAALRARRQPLVGLAAGAYVAFLLHSGVDWDWEMPAVTLAGLVSAAALLAASSAGERQIVIGPRARRGFLLAAFGLVALALSGHLAAG